MLLVTNLPLPTGPAFASTPVRPTGLVGAIRHARQLARGVVIVEAEFHTRLRPRILAAMRVHVTHVFLTTEPGASRRFIGCASPDVLTRALGVAGEP